MNSKFSALPDDIQEILDAERNAPDPALKAQGRVAGMLSATLGIPLLVPGMMDLSGPDPSSLDPSGLDPSGLDPSGLDPSGLDPSGLDPSSLDLSGLDPTLLDPSLLAGGAKAVGLGAAKGAAGVATTTTAAAASTSAGAVATGGLFALAAKPVVIGIFVAGSVLAGNLIFPEILAEKTAKPALQKAEALVEEAMEKPEKPMPVVVDVSKTKEKSERVFKRKSKKKIRKTVEKKVAALAPNRRLQQEQELLWQAKSKLHDGKAAAAIQLLAKHERLFSKGQLSEERDALQILAFARHGDDDKAQKAGVAFRKRYPKSMLLPTVEQALR